MKGHSTPSLDVGMESIGRQIRQLRLSQNLAVEELAEKSGVSSGSISQLERGLANPSFRTLQRVASALGIPLTSLFAATQPKGEAQLARTCHVVRADERKRLIFPKEDLTFELLSPNLQGAFEMIRSVFPPGYDTSSAPYRHQGEECVHVIRGAIQVHVGNDDHFLRQGDTITYDATVTHWWRNPGHEDAEMIGANCPPSF